MSILTDLRYAFRQLKKAPGFAVTAVLTLGLGIGTTTAIFTLVYDVMLKPLPFAHPERLVMTEEQVAEFRDIYPVLPMNANHFVSWQHNVHSLDALAILKEDSVPVGLGGHPLEVGVISATPDIFRVLGVSPAMGRGFHPEEGTPGRDRVVLLFHDLWRTQFQGDRGIVGRTITLNGFPYTVIGVMPESFHLPFVDTIADAHTDRSHPVGALVPLSFSGEELSEAMGDFNYFGLARLKPGVSASAAAAEINAVQKTITAGLPADQRATLSGVVTPLQDALVGGTRKSLWILLAAVAGLLLVGCLNITNLLLSRAVGRRQQMAVASALGARPVELVRMAMRETVLLAVLGCSFGIALAASLVPVLEHFLPPTLDFRGPLHLDWTGAACAVTLTLAATLLAGAVPAWIGSRTHPEEVLHSQSRLASESRGTKQLRRVLVAVEVAVSLALLLGTGLLTTSLMKLMRVGRGFDADRVLSAEIDLERKSYAEQNGRAAFYQRALERLRQLPGLEQAGVVSELPLSGDQWIDMIRLPGDPRPIMQLPSQHFRWVSPGYFEALRLRLVSGRLLSESDHGKRDALVSVRAAGFLWPGQDPVGKLFTRAGMQEPPFTVIGVIADARTVSLASPDPMMVYLPYWYRSDVRAALVLRTRAEPLQMADAVRQAIWSVDPEASVPVMRTLGGVVADSVENRRFEMDLLLVFAASALLLAGLGVYGVVTYSVARRYSEIGLRLALGAQRANIYRLVLSEGLVPVLAGVSVGIGVAFLWARALGSLLFEVSPFNPVVTSGAVSILVLVSVAACLVPARRAAAVNPVQALRSE